jgi:hypothetical protein
LQSSYQLQATVFWRLEIPMSLRTPSGECETKNRCTVGSNYEQRFFLRLEIPMSLRATSDECEAQNRCKVGDNYEQRFFAVHGYLVS